MMARCGYVALIGAPNAGKSTLLNALTGSVISIVSPKPQTTRGRVRGVVCEGESQIIFVDTPGIFAAKPSFEKAMVETAWGGVEEANIVLLLVDTVHGLDEDVKRIIETLKRRRKKAILLLNKVDKVEKPKLPILAKTLYDSFDFERSFMISALRGDGVKDILRYLAKEMPEAPWLYPDDEMTDVSERTLAEEITREQCFLKLHAELPYGVMVETEKWEEKQENGERVLRIHQNILTERESHKKMILGKGGVLLKAIGSVARRKAGEALGAKIHLFLFVKVREGWKTDPASFAAAGLEYKK